MPFSLHCVTSSSQSFRIPFVGGSGSSCWQIKSSQSISNKGQRQRTVETKDSRSKRISKWTDSCGEALHVRVCDFYFKMGKCSFIQQPPTQQTVQHLSPLPRLHNRKTGSRRRRSLCPSSLADAARPGEEKRRCPPKSRERKSLTLISQPISKQVQIAWMSRWGWNDHQSKLLPSVNLARAIGCCVAPLMCC